MTQQDKKTLFTHFILSILLTFSSGQAAAWYPPYGYPQPGMYPQQHPDNRNGQLQHYWYPYQQQVQPALRYETPRVETSVSDIVPYEQQSLVYQIRVISNSTLKNIAPVIPQTDAMILRSLGEPESYKEDHGRGFVTQYRYLLMPLSRGVLEIPQARVTGHYATHGGGEGPSFNVSGKAVKIHVRSATDAVQPWLPLYNLELTAKVRGNEAMVAGHPIEMEVETRAIGATGSQIPSVASLLKSTDFRIYPGKSTTEGEVSADGKTLSGRRVETFTLVPRYGGWLQIPGATINWWNVRQNQPEVAALITDQVNVKGPANPEHGANDFGSSAFFWLPVGVVVGILLFGLAAVFMGDGRLPGIEPLKNFFRPILGKLYAPLAAHAYRLSPRRSFHRLRTWTGRQLPISWKLWFCLRVVEREQDPAEWAQALQFLAAKHLGVRPQAHLRQLGESIARCHPHANAAQVDRLMVELDQAVYGSKPIDSFALWKHDFKKQIKPSLFPIRFRHSDASTRLSAKLPGLNPQ